MSPPEAKDTLRLKGKQTLNSRRDPDGGGGSRGVVDPGPRPVGLCGDYQSVPKVSPPLGVTAAHQVAPDTADETPRTLPSARPVCMAG